MIGNRARAARSPEAARTAALPISAFCPVFSGAFTVRFVTFSPSSGGHCSSPTRRSCAVFSRELGWMARRGDPRGPSNAHVRVHVGGALVPRSAKWGRLVRRFWPVFGTLEYAAGTMDAWVAGSRSSSKYLRSLVHVPTNRWPGDQRLSDPLHRRDRPCLATPRTFAGVGGTRDARDVPSAPHCRRSTWFRDVALAGDTWH